MSIIIDANRVEDFKKPARCHAPEIIRRISEKRMRVVIGGRLLRELAKTHMRDLIVEWLRSGCVVRLNDKDVDTEEEVFAKKSIKSDDPHVLAVAKLSSSRVLYTNDAPLMEDLRISSCCHLKEKLYPLKQKRISWTLFLRNIAISDSWRCK